MKINGIRVCSFSHRYFCISTKKGVDHNWQSHVLQGGCFQDRRLNVGCPPWRYFNRVPPRRDQHRRAPLYGGVTHSTEWDSSYFLRRVVLFSKLDQLFASLRSGNLILHGVSTLVCLLRMK